MTSHPAIATTITIPPMVSPRTAAEIGFRGDPVAACVLLGCGPGVTENVFDVAMIGPSWLPPPPVGVESWTVMTHPPLSGNGGKLNFAVPLSANWLIAALLPIIYDGKEVLTLLETLNMCVIWGSGSVGSVASAKDIGPGASTN